MDTAQPTNSMYSQVANNGLVPPPAVAPVTAMPAAPASPAAPIAANTGGTEQFSKLMDEEHHMMRYMPDLNGHTPGPDGVKEVKGPELVNDSPAPVVNPGVLTQTPVQTPVMNPVPVAMTTPVETPVSAPAPVAVPAALEDKNADLPPIEAPANPSDDAEAASFRAQLDDLLTLAIEKNSSDLHIAAEYPPQLRIDGKLVAIGTQEMTPPRIEKMFNAILDERLAKELDEKSDVDFSYPHKSGNRFRVNLFFNKGTLAGAFRLIPSKIKSIAELNLPQICFDLIKIPQGLILFTGPTGSGKSTSIAALIQEINLNFSKHIITIEDPIEYVFPKAKAMINQREIGHDALDWNRALRELLRQDPNVVLVGEMRDYETIASTITVAETGHLVFATLHTNSASQTIDRIIDVFPEGQQNQIRSQLANVIVAVIAQRLIPIAHGGRKAVFEVLLATPGVKNAIREGKTFQIDNMIQTNADLGMITLEKSLLELIKSGDISIDQAMSYTSKPDELMSLLNSGR